MIQETFARWFRPDAGPLPFPPTTVLNEGWLLRLVLQWFSEQRGLDHPLALAHGARWFSEALLETPFPEQGGAKSGEGTTHADGVIGHFSVRSGTRSGIKLCDGAKQLVVVEAKMLSGLSKGTTYAQGYDQAARTIGCMAQLLYRAKVRPESMSQLAFYVLAPQEQIDKGLFGDQLNLDSIRCKVKERARQRDQDGEGWLQDSFEPVCKIDVRAISWECIIGSITEHDQVAGGEIGEFYRAARDAAKPASQGDKHSS